MVVFIFAAAAQGQLSFQEALAGVPTSPRVAVARTELELAQKQLGVTTSALQTELSGGYTRTFSNLEPGGSDVSAPGLSESGGNLDPVGLTTVLNVVPYGPYADRVARGRWALLRAEAALRDETAAVLVDVTEQYQTALRFGEEVEVVRAKLELAAQQSAAARAGFEAGTATASTVSAAEIGVRQAEQAQQTAVLAQQQALATLAVTLGRTVGAPSGAPPPSTLAAAVFNTEVLKTEATDALSARRSDLLDAALALQEAELTAAATLRDNLPSGTLNASYANGNDGSSFQLGAQFSTGGVNAYQPTFSATIDPDTGLQGLEPGQVSSVFSVGLGLNVPLNAALSDALAAARLNVESARLRAAQTLALARLEVASRAADVTGAEGQLDLARQSLDQQQAALSVARQRFALGLLPPLEVQAAEVAVLEAELALHRAEDALRLAHLRYAAALGVDPREVF